MSTVQRMRPDMLRMTTCIEECAAVCLRQPSRVAMTAVMMVVQVMLEAACGTNDLKSFMALLH